VPRSVAWCEGGGAWGGAVTPLWAEAVADWMTTNQTRHTPCVFLSPPPHAETGSRPQKDVACQLVAVVRVYRFSFLRALSRRGPDCSFVVRCRLCVNNIIKRAPVLNPVGAFPLSLATETITMWLAVAVGFY